MTADEIRKAHEQSQIIVNITTKERYVVHLICMMRMAPGQWVDAALYKKLSDGTSVYGGQKFVRAIDEFDNFVVENS